MIRAFRNLLRRPAKAPSPAPATVPTTRLGNLVDHREAWTIFEGIRRPDWKKIREFIRRRTDDPRELAILWHDASLQWLHAVGQDLGVNYRIVESRFCLLLSARSDTAARHFAQECDSILLHLRKRIGAAAWRWSHGKHAVLMFGEEEEYYRYISFFGEEGDVYGTSSGMFLGHGYAHTALPSTSQNLHVLAHEFVHLCLSHHRSLPLWLNEGFAGFFEREIFDPQGLGFDRDSTKGQRTFWTPDTLQRFWSGKAFQLDEERKMSYNLAELFVGMMLRQLGDLSPFIIAAKRADAGEGAAREHLDISLGEVAAAVLGEGDWTPRPAVFAFQKDAKPADNGSTNAYPKIGLMCRSHKLPVTLRAMISSWSSSALV